MKCIFFYAVAFVGNDIFIIANEIRKMKKRGYRNRSAKKLSNKYGERAKV